MENQKPRYGNWISRKVILWQTIGTLLEQVPCEAELGTHLHLELTRDGQRRDPADILPDQPKGTQT